MTLCENIGMRLKKIAKHNKLTQAQMGEQLDITNSAICRYMKGNRMPHCEVIVSIAKKYGVSTDYLLTGKMKNKTDMKIDEISV